MITKSENTFTVEKSSKDGSPSQVELNIVADNYLRIQYTHLVTLCEKIKLSLPVERRDEFEACQAMWKKYCHAWACFESDITAGGSIRSKLYADVAVRLVKRRISELKRVTAGSLT